METILIKIADKVKQRPHSLGILIEWKPEAMTSYSIDWRLMSPLAGDIN